MFRIRIIDFPPVTQIVDSINYLKEVESQT